VKNIAFDHGGTIQLDAISTNRPLDLSTYGQLFRDYVAIHLGAFADQNRQRPNLALDAAKYLYRALTVNFANDCQVTTDGGNLLG
jgi:hypothetical protein